MDPTPDSASTELQQNIADCSANLLSADRT
jgi:hypothetical protein